MGLDLLVDRVGGDPGLVVEDLWLVGEVVLGEVVLDLLR